MFNQQLMLPNAAFDYVIDGVYIKTIVADSKGYIDYNIFYEKKIRFITKPLIAVISLAFITNFGISPIFYFASLHIDNSIIIWSISKIRALTKITLQTKLKSIRSSPTRNSLILCTSDDKIITLDVTPFLNEGAKKREHED